MTKDKIAHALVGAIIGMAGTIVAGPFFGVASAAIIGSIKEVRDELTQEGVVEFMDFVYTFGGGLVGALLALLLKNP